MRWLITLLALASSQVQAQSFTWKINNVWSSAYEKKFSEFVAQVGNSGCHSLTECLTSQVSNPSYATKTPKAQFPADCADLPYALRMYLAWVEELPFDYVSEVEPANPAQEPNSDIRYTLYGNKPTARRTFQAGSTYNFLSEYNTMRDAVSTATYRMHYNEVSDFYPPALDLKNIRPGTVVYDPAGHAAIIYKIESDGRIRMIDAHPDNSITHITFDQKFVRSRAAHGAGFKNWRPELNTEPTKTLAGFSTEEFNPNFAINGQNVTYYDYVRAKMAGGSLSFDPLVEIQSMLADTCSNIHDRERAVQAALAVNFNQNTHPDRLPQNIYGTSGDWEEYSTPSRDARLKVAFVEQRQELARFIKMYRAGDARIQYQPTISKYSDTCESDKTCYLVAALMTAYEKASTSASCQFAYINSAGQRKSLTYEDVQHRLFALSFDPYHCAELRWGETGPGLNTCADDRFKMQWYTAEQGLRNQTERTYEARMDLDVNGTAKSLGVAQAPDVDLWAYLNSQLHGGSADVLRCDDLSG